ncbi:MAG: DUF2252 family protein [Myxococcota bacterium]|nr:DUF2252 family protein [Myxococcota bacterium]
MKTFLLFLMTACQIEDRTGFLQEQLWLDNRKWWYRDRDLLGGKFQKMADDPYNFMRGTLRLHWMDNNRPGREASSFLRLSASSEILVFADPHPENWAVLTTERGDRWLEMNDLDSAEFGAWHFDLRRLVLGLQTIAMDLEGCDCMDSIVAQTVLGYEHGLRNDWVFEGNIWGDLKAEADEEGEERKRFFKQTDAIDGENRLKDSIWPSVPIPVSDWISQTHFRLLDVARVYGTGVSSFPAIRYLVLFDEGSEEGQDDRLVQIREVGDPLVFDRKSFQNNVSRIRFSQEVLWESSANVWMHDSFVAEGLEWKTISYSSWLQDIEHGKIEEGWVEGEYRSDDIDVLSYVLGAALGARHRESETRQGHRAGDIILQDLEAGGGVSALVSEIFSFSLRDREQLFADYTLFVDLIEEHGPLMGWER